ncbi:MAG: nucleotidyltransferase family protein [Candidatus Woesearchaeota archaeon]|nr:nucleotidyltransferase family protein [Candidatus Woesearchaeota archaeon]
MKERVTFTIDSEILKQIDSTIDGSMIKNRSHAAEILIAKALGNNAPKTAVILAGGKGKRFGPITSEIPKPMIPLHDKPLLYHAICLFRKFGIKNIIISVGYKADKIKEFFGNGRNFGVSITYVEESEPLGTAGALRLATPYIEGSFIVCNADDLMDINLAEMYSFHKSHSSIATIALTTIDDPSNYGVALMNGDKITAFVEKPKREDAPSKLISAGLYILERPVLDMIPKGFSMLENDVFPKLAGSSRLIGYSFSGMWIDVGTPERYEQAIREWKDIE